MASASDTLVAGVDVGTECIKAVVLDGDRQIRGRFVTDAVGYFQPRIREALAGALEEAGATGATLAQTCITGFGARCADDIGATMFASDSSSHARGATHHLAPPMTVLDLGAREPTLIDVNGDGVRTVSRSLRKCAVGIGSFMAFAARHLDVHPTRLMELASAADRPALVNSYCSVFAETELLQQLRGGATREEIALGCMHSIAQRVLEIGHFNEPLVVTGGIAEYYPGVVAALEAKAAVAVKVVPEPLLCGALGAALLALEAV